MTMEARGKGLTLARLAVYLAAFFAVWTLREFYVRQQTIAWLGEWGGALCNGATKLLIWTLPALLLVRRYPGDMEIPQLFEGRIHWPRVLLWMAGLVVCNLVAALVTYEKISIHPSFAASTLIGTVLLVGITEEAVFRGLVLNTLLKRYGQTAALVASSALFVLIHFPIWATKGVLFVPLDLLRSCVSVFMLGMVFGYSFLKERNLLPPILLHMTWNLAVILWIGG